MKHRRTERRRRPIRRHVVYVPAPRRSAADGIIRAAGCLFVGFPCAVIIVGMGFILGKAWGLY